ncbi:SMI1/KNR4 family protein [Streptomyces sp. NPDC050418]|uniref:SMI1/KNR4 family protein n=1 Tax=Streptomyces sp. NPDC050418 TaxID=3365612 RepID=UPI0037A8E7B5
MSEHGLSSSWLLSWASRMLDAEKAMMVDHEEKYGFQATDNHARLADSAEREAALALTRATTMAPDLITFYRTIGGVWLPDVGNGYWIDSASGVLVQLAEYGTVHADEVQGGLVIGSNGGGLSYVVALDGAVWRTRTATLDEPELDKVADDMRQFLELLEHSVVGFAATGDPGLV